MWTWKATVDESDYFVVQNFGGDLRLQIQGGPSFHENTSHGDVANTMTIPNHTNTHNHGDTVNSATEHNALRAHCERSIPVLRTDVRQSRAAARCAAERPQRQHVVQATI